MSTRQILGGIGAAVGGFFFGPQGAQWGWVIGSAVGGAVDPQVIKGPSVGDISAQTSQEGTPRPIVFALSQPMAGNIIATSEPKIVKKKQSQGKGGPKVETESVYRTYAVGVCEGPIGRFVRVWRNGELVYNADDPAMEGTLSVTLFGNVVNLALHNNKFLERARFFLGTYEQNASPDLETIFGVGTTPAHRGTAYMVMKDEDLTDLRGAIPQWTFQVETCEPGPPTFIEFVAGAFSFSPTTAFGWSEDWEWAIETEVDCGTFVSGSRYPSLSGDAYRLASIMFFAQTFPSQQQFHINFEAGPEGPAPDSDAVFFSVQVDVNGEEVTGFLRVPFTYTLQTDRDPDVSQWSFGSMLPNSNIFAPGDLVRITFLPAPPSPPDAPVPPCTYSLPGLVRALCNRVGLEDDKIDVSLLSGDVRGFTVINTYPCIEALRALAQIFLFDVTTFDAKVRFEPRGQNSVANIIEDDMLDDENEIEQSRRSDNIQIPRVLHLNYYDVLGGLATEKQSSERAFDGRATGETSLQSSVLMTAEDAARAVAIQHKIMVEDQRGEFKFALPDSWLHIVPASTVFVTSDGRTKRARVIKADTNDGYQEYVLLHDRQSAYVSTAEAFPISPPSTPPLNSVGPTIIIPLDIHILRDSDDNAGLSYYVAVSGLTGAWQGARVELSLDGGANYIDAADTNSAAVIGETTTTLADHPQEFPDEVNSFTVQLHSPGAELIDATLEELLNGANLAIVGDEMIQFGSAVETDPVNHLWELSSLHRGRKGTATASHAIESRFVLLDRSVISLVPSSIAAITQTLTFRATSFGQSEDDGTVVSMVYTGRSQIEREVAYLEAHLDGTDAVVTWQGVGRLGAGAAAAHGVRFAGYRVIFDDGASPITVETDEQTLTQDISTLTLPITIHVRQLNDLTGAGPDSQVILT